MKKLIAAAIIPFALMAAAPAFADDAVSMHQVQNVLDREDFKSQTQGIRFYFSGASHPAVARRITADETSSLRTRKLGRSSEEACQWVMMSVLLNFANTARATGGNAVINIRSNWRNQEFASATEYQCAAGFLMAGVAIKGDIVTLR